MFSPLFIASIFTLLHGTSRAGLRTTASARVFPGGWVALAAPGFVRAKGPKVLGMGFEVERNVHEHC